MRRPNVIFRFREYAEVQSGQQCFKIQRKIFVTKYPETDEIKRIKFFKYVDE